ncbi:hypothetical protein LguiA_028058 [Lonicera macranthoides]
MSCLQPLVPQFYRASIEATFFSFDCSTGGATCSCIKTMGSASPLWQTFVIKKEAVDGVREIPNTKPGYTIQLRVVGQELALINGVRSVGFNSQEVPENVQELVQNIKGKSRVIWLLRKWNVQDYYEQTGFLGTHEFDVQRQKANPVVKKEREGEGCRRLNGSNGSSCQMRLNDCDMSLPKKAHAGHIGKNGILLEVKIGFYWR